MKSLCIFFLSIFTAFSQVPTWQAATGLPGSDGRLTRADNGDFFFATTASRFDFGLGKVVFETKLFRSTDGGISFSQQGDLINETFASVTSLAAVNGDLWIAGEGAFGNLDLDWFYRSTDGGLTWTSSGSGDEAFRSIAYMREVDGTWYAGGTRNYFSDDSGATWQPLPGDFDEYPYFDEFGGRRFYRQREGLAISDDMGATFDLTLPNGAGFGQNVVSYEGKIFAIKAPGPPAESSDNGSTWSEGTPLVGFDNPDFRNINTFDQRLLGYVFEQSVGGGPRLVFREGGEAWGEISFGGSLTDPIVDQIFEVGDRLVTRIGGGVHSLDLGGSTGGPVIKFQPVSKTVKLGSRHVLAAYATGERPMTYQWFEGAPGDISKPIAGAVHATHATAPLNAPLDYWVRISNAAGTIDSEGATANAQEVWEKVEKAPGVPFSQPYGPIATPMGLKVIAKATDLMHTSTDDGETWDDGVAWTNGLPWDNPRFILNSSGFITFDDGLFHFVRQAFDDLGEYATSPDGVNWTVAAGDIPGQQRPTGLARRGNTVLISLNDSSRDGMNWMARSLDGGATFSLAVNGIGGTPKKVQFLDDGKLIAIDGGVGISHITSSDNGNTWVQRQVLPGEKTEIIASLFNDGTTLFASLNKPNNIYEGKGLMKSEDGGVTWTRVAFEDTNLTQVAVVGDLLVVGNDSSPPAFFVSEDDGSTFEALSTVGLQAFSFLDEPVVSGGNLLLPSSSIFRLRVGDVATGSAPVIVTQPESIQIAPGTSATLTVEATGEGELTYQWFNAAIPVGTNSPTHVTDPAFDFQTTYSVEISNGFGNPVRSNVVTVSFIPTPKIVADLKPAAYFVETARSFGPGFSFDTPTSTTYQWYFGEAGDISNPVVGATGATIRTTDLVLGEKVWLRATDGNFTTDSSAVAFTAMTCEPFTLDLLSRDPDGRTWDEGANSFMAEQGNFVVMGTPDPGEPTARFPLPYNGFATLADRGYLGGGTPNDISNNGRFHLFGNGNVYDFETQTTSATYNSALTIEGDNAEQIGTSGRYLLVRTANDDLVAGDDNGRVDLVLHDRSTGSFRGLTAPTNQSIDATLPAEMTEAEDEVFFSHFATDLLVENESGNLYVYDVASDSLSVPPPVQGKGAWSMFLDASSNGRFLLFMWNPQIVALRESEGSNLLAPQQYLYVHDRVDDELSYLETPFPAEFTRDHTISNDGQTVSFIHWGANLLQPHVAHRVPGEDLWAVKLLIPAPTRSTNTADLQMSDSGKRFIYNTLAWSLQTPQYSTGSGNEFNVGNVMFIESGGASVFMPASFSDWTTSELSTVPADERTPSADPDGDGIINYFEFLAGNSPLRFEGSLLKKGPAGTVTYREIKDAPVRFLPQISTTLNSWTAIAGAEMTRVEIESGIWEVTLQSDAASAFFRLSAPVPQE